MIAQSNGPEFLGRLGLRLPAITLKHLQSGGILCQPAVSVDSRQETKSSVLRAVASGGAIAELGAYCDFVDAAGNALTRSERMDRLGVNGLHAILIAPVLIRLEMVRNRLTYDLLITRHALTNEPQNQRPQLESSTLFHGCSSAMPVSNDAEQPGKMCPPLYSHSREAFGAPAQFRDSVQRLVAAAWCIVCRHCHLSAEGKNVEKGSTYDI